MAGRKMDLMLAAALWNEAGAVMFAVDSATEKILLPNRALAASLGKSASEVEGKALGQIFSVGFASFLRSLAKECAGGVAVSRPYEWPEAGRFIRVSAGRVGAGADMVVLFTITPLGVSSDAAFSFKSLASLPCIDDLEADLKRQRDTRRCALLHFELSGAASIGDLYGYRAVDDILREMGGWLAGSLPPSARLYRAGEVSFCILMSAAAPKAAIDLAQIILERAKSPWLPASASRPPVYATLAMGVVYGVPVSGDIRSLLHRTLEASDSRQGYSLYDSVQDRLYQNRLALRQSLTASFQRGMQGFSVCYQPVVNGRTERWVGAEALCRWAPPGGGPVPVMDVLRELEVLGLHEQLDAWVLDTAVTQCKHWGLDKRQFYLDVNVSPLQEPGDHYTLRLMRMLHRRGFPLDKLNLDITESRRADLSPGKLESWRSLCREGVGLSLDGFGTGFSAFDNLIDLPVKILKTEGVFIANLEKDSYRQTLMQSLIELAHTAGIRVVAEGVETPGQKQLLQAYGVDFMQGHLFSRALGPEAFQRELGRYKAAV